MTCPQCRQSCQDIIVNSNLEASEHYCPRCHKSYDLTSSEIRALVQGSRQQEPAPAGAARR